MKSLTHVALATFLSMLVFEAEVCMAVDASRAAAQAKLSPDGVGISSSGGLNSAKFNNNGAFGSPAIRDRTSASTSSNWNNPKTSDNVFPGLDPTLSEYWAPIPDPVAQPAPLQKWRLGIYPENTDTGVRVGEVVRGSAAERAGLEVNDRLVSIGGYQVGYVAGTLYDIGTEFERDADEKGWVRVLVQNNRDGKLMNMPLQLDPRHESITGAITYRNRSALPRDAVATVELREVLRADLRPVTIAKQTISPATRVPISFSIDYDPTEINSRRTYVIDANITAAGRQIYAMRQSAPIFNGRPTTDVQLLVESTSTGGPATNRNEQLAQITTWFREYLRREPRAQELYVWESHLARGGSLSDVQLQILSTPEFYYQSSGDDMTYIRRMFQLVVGRQPSQQEVFDWNRRLQDYNRMRPELAKEFLAMAGAQASNSNRR
jgi:uncharacterized lipoprotein YbaY